MAIIAEVNRKNKKEIITVARIVNDKKKSVDFAVIISDKWHDKKLGSILTDYMINIAKDMNFKSIYAYTMSSNIAMLEILRRRGFKMKREDETTIFAKLKF